MREKLGESAACVNNEPWPVYSQKAPETFKVGEVVPKLSRQTQLSFGMIASVEEVFCRANLFLTARKFLNEFSVS
jgi:hypothetical protein